MEKEKIKILFDATMLAQNYESKNGSRTGIFWAAYSILLEMLKHSEFDIWLYTNNYNFLALKLFKQYLKLEKAQVVCSDSKLFSLRVNLVYLKQKNRRTDDKKTQTIFMIIKRIFIKICLSLIEVLHGKSGSEAVFQKEIVKEFSVYFSPLEPAPDFILKNNKIQRYTILYDTVPLIFPEFYKELSKKGDFWYDRLIASINKQDYYFAISENTRQDFIKHVDNIDKNKIKTVLLAASENFYRCEDKEKNIQIRKKYNIPQDKKYIFSLCTIEPRKNLIFAVKNFIEFLKRNNIDDLVFVLGGGHWKQFIKKLDKELDGLGIYKNKIIKAGYVDDQDLASLYSSAEMFVYPSIYEGFGLPPLEAMQCGCSIITSNLTSIPEVVGDAALMIDPRNDEQLIKAYEKLYFNPELRTELSEKGLNRAKEFSWAKSVNIMVNEILKNYNSGQN